MSKIIIYQVLPRLFGNYNENLVTNGTIEQNGCGKLESFTKVALNEIKSLGITHIWYTGIIEHATKTDYSSFGIKKDHPAVIKGNAGSPYAIKDYYDVNPDLAVNVTQRMNEFEKLVTRTHDAGLKVIIDFVPNHVARQYHSDAKPNGIEDFGAKDHPEWFFSPFNNFYYITGQAFRPHFDIGDYYEMPAKATGNDHFSASPGINDWYETVKLNYGVNYVEGKQKQFDPIPDTWQKMKHILQYWASKKVDGFRCDMAEMVPVEFWSWVIPQIKVQYPDIIFIAEVYNPAEYRNYIFEGKFDFLYDKVGMYDTLRSIVSRNQPARNITAKWMEVSDIQDKMLQFLENHDEQRIASGFFAGDGIYACPAMIIAATLTSAPLMIYFGQELGEKGMDHEGFSGIDGRTSIFDYWSLASVRAWANNGKFDGTLLNDEQKYLRECYKKLLNITLNEKAISHGLMFDLEYINIDNPKFNTHEQYAFFRKYEDELLLIVTNFHDKHLDTEVAIPLDAFTYLNLKNGSKFVCKNLLNDAEEEFITELSVEKTFSCRIPAWSGKIYRLTLTP
jgi:glycosidase